ISSIEAHYREQGKDWCKTLDLLDKFTQQARNQLHYNNNNQIDRYLTAVEVSEIWEISRQTVTRWKNEGLLKVVNRKFQYSHVSKVMGEMGKKFRVTKIQ
ncbi:MAG TPA: hypothetical protein VK982_05830, partial [Bacteroidales bacterium]|nr:hypothetical protein [Bacteroidales bacterium]